MMIDLLDKIKTVLRGRLNNEEGPRLPRVEMVKQLKLQKIRIIRADGTIEEKEL